MLVKRVEEYKRRGMPQKRSMDCVKEDIARKGVTSEMKSDRVERKGL